MFRGLRFSNTVDRSILQPGDHIYCWSSIFHHHHAIYVGNEEVIHVYANEKILSEVRKDSLDFFARGRSIKRVRYGVPSWHLMICAPGTLYSFPKDPGQLVVTRAYKALADSVQCPYDFIKSLEASGHCELAKKLADIREKKRWRYNILFRNCETFCLQCTAPEHQQGSHQGKMIFFNPLATIVSGVRARLGDLRRATEVARLKLKKNKRFE